MARKPEVFVRELTIEEGRRLQRVARTSRQPVRLRRAVIVLASAAGRPVPDIAELFATSQGYVRRVIHEFNDHGLGALDPKWGSGPVRKIGQRTRERICRLARCHPQDLGLPFTCWSLAKLVDYLTEHKIVASVSRETLRQILGDAGIRWRRTKTWKASTDPEFRQKKDRILDLYDHPPADGRVICADEFGPLNLQPRPGGGWFPINQPARLPATFTRTAGVRHRWIWCSPRPTPPG